MPKRAPPPEIAAVLLKGEEARWWGRPAQGIVPTRMDIVLVPLSVLGLVPVGLAFGPVLAGGRGGTVGLYLAMFLAIGSAVGSIFAAITFAVAAFSLPMIADRDVDMITAALSSIHAVLRNKAVMLLWAAIIAVVTAVGFATALLGLGVVMPWLAYAAWHGYRETLDASAWPALE